MKRNKILKIVIPAAICLLILGLIIGYHNSTKINRNSSRAIGNTAGNLLNGGIFCENNGVIYFANPYDHYKLYSMSSDCSHIKNLTDDTASYINVVGNQIYYIKNNSTTTGSSTILRGELFGVIRCKLNGGQYTTLHSGYSTDLALSGNTLIFNAVRNSKAVTQSIDISGKKEKVLNESDYTNACVIDGHLYYAKPTTEGGTDHSIYDMRISDGSSTSYLVANATNVSLVDNVVYYIDLDNDYALTAVDLATNTRKVLTKDKVVRYNVYRDVIFYQEESYTHSLMRMRIDGSEATEITEGDVSSISCTSKYTFYQLYGTDTLYRVDTYVGNDVQQFFIKAQ